MVKMKPESRIPGLASTVSRSLATSESLFPGETGKPLDRKAAIRRTRTQRRTQWACGGVKRREREKRSQIKPKSRIPEGLLAGIGAAVAPANVGLLPAVKFGLRGAIIIIIMATG